MKVAVLCSGLGRVNRGYERFAGDLIRNLASDIDIEAYGARGEAARSGVHPVRYLSRDGLVSRSRWIAERPVRGPYYWEAATYLASVLRFIVTKRYDILHVMDPPIVNFCHHLRPLLGSTKVLFTNGLGMHDIVGTRADHLHQVASVTYHDALHYLPPERMTLLPLPVDTRLFAGHLDVSTARRQLGVDPDRFLVVAVSALNRGHKRVDHLIREIAPILQTDLLVVGRTEDSSLIALGKDLLGPRFHVRELPFERISLAYRAADVVVLTSLIEGFAFSVVEAMLSSVSILVHRNPHFQWLVDDENTLVRMDVPGELRDRIVALAKSPEDPRMLESRRSRAAERFSWDSLRSEYVRMYSEVATG